MQPFRLSALFKSIHIHVNVGEQKRRHKSRSFILGCIPNSSLTNFDLWISIVTDWSRIKMKNKNLICNLWESVVGRVWPHIVTTHCKYKCCFVPHQNSCVSSLTSGVCLWSPTWSAGQENPGDLSLGLRPGHEQWLHRWVLHENMHFHWSLWCEAFHQTWSAHSFKIKAAWW